MFVLVSEEKDITCVGICKGLTNGENIDATGDYVEHPVYGEQFKIMSYKVVAPKDSVSVERYLSSGAVKGIGAALAKRIVKRFGDDTFRIMEEEPERLAEIKGISERMAREIAVQMEERKDLRDALVYLQQFGISNTLAIRIFDTYGTNLYGILKENPYKLAEDIDGIGFKIADEIASRIGIHTDSDYRIRSGILYTLLQAVGEGHCYLPMEQVLERAEQLLQVAAVNIEPQLANLVLDKKLVIKEEKVYAYTYYYAELSCARMLFELNMPMRESRQHVESIIKSITGEIQIELDEFQEKGKHLIVIDDNYDSMKADDDIIGIKTWFNEKYVKDSMFYESCPEYLSKRCPYMPTDCFAFGYLNEELLKESYEYSFSHNNTCKNVLSFLDE